MSLLGLLRHMADVELVWFRRRFAGLDVAKRYQTDAEPDGDFDGAVADQAVVDAGVGGLAGGGGVRRAVRAGQRPFLRRARRGRQRCVAA